MYGYSQGATSDHIFWVSILIAHAALPAMGVVVAVSPNGRSAGFVSDLSCRHSSNRSHAGKANGPCGSTQLFVHAIDNGTRTSKDSLSALSLTRLINRRLR
jgi:hypothetical protein